MAQSALDHDLVRRVLRSVTTTRETAEEIQTRYTQLYPPSFFFKDKPSISLKNLKWALQVLAQEGYVREELTRFTDRVLKFDTKVYCLTQEGFTHTLRKK